MRFKYDQVPWSDIARTRDKLIHHYFGVNLDILWGIITNDLPPLKTNVTLILDELGYEN